MLSKRTLLIAGAVVVVVCAVVAWFVVMPRTDEVSSVVVNQHMEDLKNHVSTLTQRVETLTEQASQKVVIVREDVRKEVAVLTPDDVCDALNSELSSFRMGTRPGGICDSD
jgi:HAMP domain-containing protein